VSVNKDSTFHPRKLTSPSGRERWQAADGKTYDTIAAAREAVARVEELTGTAPVQMRPIGPQESIFSILFLLAIGVFGICSIYVAVIGWESLTWGLVLLFAILGFGGVSALMTGGVALYGRFTSPEKHASADAKVQRAFDVIIGGGLTLIGSGSKLILWLLGIGAVAILAWLAFVALASAFDGVSKGSAIIIVLLVGILLSLNRIADARR
jgi:hypothetical protein